MKSNFYIKKDKVDDTLHIYYQQEYIGYVQQPENGSTYCRAIPKTSFGGLSFYHTTVESAIIGLVCGVYETGGRKVEKC